MDSETSRLLEVLKTQAFKRGDFVLSSGRRSCYYIDARLASLHPEGSYLIGRLIFDRIKDDDVDAIGGLTLGADPIATAVSLTSYVAGKPIPAFIARKEQKDHGRKRLVEGPLPPNAKVVIVDDVVTTGESSLKAVYAVEREGGRVIKVIALLDRLEGGAEAIRAAGYQFEAIFTVEDLGVTREEIVAFERDVLSKRVRQSMPKEIVPSSYECECGHQSHFFENTIREAKSSSFKKRIYLLDSEREEHTIVFHQGQMVDIICPKTKGDV
ncbi:MAG: orotate phosphoribosyltransferase [Chloroflexi bacterium]|nr:orotate phosphoribosyltransferase [Chloroflexota bacterium]